MNHDDRDKLAGWIFTVLFLYIGVAVLGLLIGLGKFALSLFNFI